MTVSRVTHQRNPDVAEVKRKWRQQQISAQSKLNASVNSSWRKSQTSCVWCGWLSKRSSGILERWQPRWFELRQEPGSQWTSRAALRAVLQYTGRGRDGREETKRLELVAARRICEHDSDGRVCLSVRVAGRTGHRVLAAGTEREARDLLACVAAILPPFAAQ